MGERPLKPAAAADAAAAARGDEADVRARAWWARVPRTVTAPREVFRALRETDDLDVAARAEPILLIVLLAGMGGILLTPAWGTLLDDPAVDGLVVAVVTFVGGIFYGAAGYLLLGVAAWVGVRGVGIDVRFQEARQVVGFAALPVALSLLVTLPVILVAFGGDWFRDGGADDGVGRTVVLGLGLGFVGWAAALLVLGLRTTFELPWRAVVGALALMVVLVAAFAVLPGVLWG